MLPAVVLTSVLALLQGSQAILPIKTDSFRFIKPVVNDDSNDNTVFFVNGVDYQPGGSSDYTAGATSDVLSDGEVCARDATVLQNLGVNTIRVYTIDPDLNHDECMSIFNAAGIYVILDVNSPLAGESLNRYEPWTTYTTSYLERVFKVAESFRGFSNTLGFFVGNEVINDATSAKYSPKYIRAVTRDLKQYIKARADDGGRYIPVGYSAADVVDLREPTFEYLTCAIDGTEDDSRIDFFGLNSYEWCSGSSDWQTSSYGEVLDSFSNATVPVFFSEYGCNKNSPRTFDEVDDGLYGGLEKALSGGLVYEYSQEAADYGLVTINDDDTISLSEDYYNLQEQLKDADIPSIKESSVTNNTIATCKSQNNTVSFSFDFSLPDAPSGVSDYIKNGISVNHTGAFVDVSKYTDLYAKGADVSNNDSYYSIMNNASSDASMYLTVASSNLINDLDVSTTLVSSSSAAVSSSRVSVSSVSSISSSSSKADAGKNIAQSWGIGLMGILAALL